MAFTYILREYDSEAFLRAVQQLGVPVVATKLSPEKLMAMKLWE